MIYDLANHVLETIRERFAEYEVDLPARQFIMTGGQGSSVHEGEQLSISMEQVYSGLPGDQAQNPVKCTEPTTVVFGIELVRCVPQPKQGRSTAPVPVEASEIDKAARAQMQDAQILMEAGLIAAESTWLAGGMADVTAGTPTGGLQSMVMSLVMVSGDKF